MNTDNETNYDHYSTKPLREALMAYDSDFARTGETGTFHDWLAQTVNYVEYAHGATLDRADW